MSVLVYTESENGKLKKAALEVASYAKAVADAIGGNVTAVSINSDNNDDLANYGVHKSLEVSDEKLQKFNADAYAEVITQAAKKVDAKVVVISQSANAKYLAPLLSVNLSAAYASNVVDVPKTDNEFTVERTAFTNKAFNHTSLSTDIKILGLSNNAFGLKENKVEMSKEDFSAELNDDHFKINVESVDKNTDKVSIADAEVVVSGGRGLKDPKNWGMIEDLADVLGAATACSKPVSDMGWRPHSEHVGQTGKPVASNLYIAIGISGAIQHLAGISASKTKVVINTDDEAPFFKAADYGIVGDAFEVVPKLIEKLKDFKANNA
ncbi:electron transfer flavoprotein subunit alpha/FixB family protein [Psychroflexus sp. ALD_RP9]|uniref:electron transfer flavoprotein subunit alpha/FixB family protein n=1 Tax=Psychroflexus sp. ALD_RP9 TaxID=2777186 RepID=UPI001A8ECC6E|nr:electron transfer flavoprotein subunit alpha/FixB family protein [Psychroflexus sp. ALD_RP9]QSS97647.1 electron transfer flavoprotein subunit alpha/FixB family protein [Psychroflexus sp. ALD_RP9]